MNNLQWLAFRLDLYRMDLSYRLLTVRLRRKATAKAA